MVLSSVLGFEYLSLLSVLSRHSQYSFHRSTCLLDDVDLLTISSLSAIITIVLNLVNDYRFARPTFVARELLFPLTFERVIAMRKDVNRCMSRVLFRFPSRLLLIPTCWTGALAFHTVVVYSAIFYF